LEHFSAIDSQNGFSGLFVASEHFGWLVGGVVICVSCEEENANVDTVCVAGAKLILD
jgi:hypothetical protein